MDRRHFFQTLLSAPLLTPLLLASQARERDREIYLISDQPQTHLLLLLEELNRGSVKALRSFAFTPPHPEGKAIKTALLRSGWIFRSQSKEMDLNIAFVHLHQPASSSFSLVKDGKIRDIRFGNLRSLWIEMGQKHKRSSLLTVASLNRIHAGTRAGESAVVYMDGFKRDILSLNKNTRMSYSSRRGHVTIQTTNGYVRVIESSCQHKICLYSPPVSLSGERIICAPNHLLIEIQGGPVDTVIG